MTYNKEEKKEKEKKSKKNVTHSYENQFGVLLEDILPGGGTRKKIF